MSFHLSRPPFSFFHRGGQMHALPAILGLAMLTSQVGAQQTSYARTAIIRGRRRPQAAIKTLSPQAQAVIAWLAKFGDERIGNWKYHFGELPGGQSAALDDSAWGEIRPPSRINRTGENWLRKWVGCRPR